MAITQTQVPNRFREVIDEQRGIYGGRRSITKRNILPDQDSIPLDNQGHWLEIPSVICVFVDMIDSTRLSASKDPSEVAGAYQLFTGTAVRLFDAFDSSYIDVRGDGVFALFDSDKPNTALAAAVTFKTFSEEEFTPRMKTDFGMELGAHLGIDVDRVLVRRIGMRRAGGRSDRQNEVWAGTPVNTAAKLASQTVAGDLLVSERFFQRLKSPFALRSCGCRGGTYVGEHVDLWEVVDVSRDPRFDFERARRLKTRWCASHGAEYCGSLLKLDEING